MRLKNLCLAGIGIFSTSLGFSARIHADELPDIIEKIKPAIVGIGTYQRTRTPPAIFRGTGFAISDGLHILTNAHVLPEAIDRSKFEMLAVFTRDGEKQNVRQAIEIATDESHDIAVLRIGGSPLPFMRLGDSSKVREGESYAFTGYPIGMVLGLNPVTHRGIVSAISPIAIPAHTSQRLNPKIIRRLSEPHDVFQLDATAYPGNSGSPLYDVKSGSVVGIINKVFVQETKENLLERPSGISYAIPIRYAVSLLNENGIKR
ncbi:MAG: serine protease [Methylocaldum sp.]|nr:serine protease [Methylocaldum sp.]